jgi:hypothetical protein
VRFPFSRRELGDARGRVLADALQDIDEVRVGIDVVHSARGDQALHDASVLGADLRSAEQPVLFAEWNRAQSTLDVVRVDGYVGVIEEALQSRATLSHVGHRLGQWVAGPQPLPLELRVNPAEEFLDQWFAVREPMFPLGLPLELGFADRLLDLVELADLAQRLGRVLWLGRLGFEEASPGMGPVLRVGDPVFLAYAA